MALSLKSLGTPDLELYQTTRPHFMLMQEDIVPKTWCSLGWALTSWKEKREEKEILLDHRRNLYKFFRYYNNGMCSYELK